MKMTKTLVIMHFAMLLQSSCSLSQSKAERHLLSCRPLFQLFLEPAIFRLLVLICLRFLYITLLLKEACMYPESSDDVNMLVMWRILPVKEPRGIEESPDVISQCGCTAV